MSSMHRPPHPGGLLKTFIPPELSFHIGGAGPWLSMQATYDLWRLNCRADGGPMLYRPTP